MSIDYSALNILPADSAQTAAGKQRIAGGLLRLRKGLRKHLSKLPEHMDRPPESDKVLRLATWNLREFGEENKYGKRLDDSYYFIAEIISEFDLVAIQEVTSNLTGLRKLLDLLGSTWKAIATDVSGNSERMVFMYNRNTCWFRGIAGELTLGDSQIIYDPEGLQIISTGNDYTITFPQITYMPLQDPALRIRGGRHQLKKTYRLPLPPGTKVTLPAGSELIIPTGTPVTGDQQTNTWQLQDNPVDRIKLKKNWALELPDGARASGLLQFARTPYLVAFQAGWLKMVLCTVHIYYGDNSAHGLERRRREIARLTKMLAKKAKSESDSEADSFFFALGDFNIKGKNHKTYEALVSNGFEIPEQIRKIPAGTNVSRDEYYDQIAIYTGNTNHQQVTRVETMRAGVFDFFKYVYRSHADDNGQDEAYYLPLMNSELQRRRAAGRSKASSWKYKDWRTFQMSDHLPMWIELKIDYSDEYLSSIKSKT